MPPKPRLTACVANHGFDRGEALPADRHIHFRADLLAALARDDDLDREATIAAEKHELHLRTDLHRDCACAVLIVSDRAGVDDDARLAALHARREGAHRFILLIAEFPSGGHPDAAERDARILLESLGVDGNAAPAVRAPLHDRNNDRAWSPEALTALTAALDDLPAFLDPAPLLTTPPTFLREAALLDAIRPLLAPATRLAQVPVEPSRTTDLGSHYAGVPYLEQNDAWPQCPRCQRPMPAILQVDRRDLLHAPPPSHGLFVVYTCQRCHTDEIRHHPAPHAARRRTAPPEAVPHARPALLRPVRPCHLLPDRHLFHAEHPDVAAHLCTLTGMNDPLPAFDRITEAMGLASLQHQPHFGGHHATAHRHPLPTPRCDVCDAPCVHVVQLSVGEDRRSLWACRDHPSSSFHQVHP